MGPERKAAPEAKAKRLSTITQEYLKKDLLRFTTAGSVDDGKSTLIGRLLYDSKAIFQDQLDSLKRTSELRGEKEVNLAYLTDGLRAEREQGITIDVAYRYFATPRRKFIIADTPGHEQYTRNMVTGASTADLAIILIDARNGVLTQSRRHGFIASLLGIPHVLVAVNKMDLVDFAEDVFNSIVEEYTDFSSKLDIHDITFIPISALLGDNVVRESTNMPWYDGATVIHHLESVTISADRNLVDFRFPVQYVIRPHQDFRGFAGSVVSGTVRVGEEIIALPSMRKSRVREIHLHNGPVDEAVEGQAVVLALDDEIDISRGDMIVRSHNVPRIGNRIEAALCWMDESKPLKTGAQYILQHGTRVTRASMEELRYRININTLHRESAPSLALNEIGRATIATAQPLFFDAYRDNRSNGGFVLIDPATNRTVAAGMIRTDTATVAGGTAAGEGAKAGTAAGTTGAATARRPRDLTPDPGSITRVERERRNGHEALVIWLTGISGSGKSTIARALEKRLFDEGRHVVRLDGDNLRLGLNSDLAFSAEDREENLRRAAEVARLFFEAGNIVICSFISPFASSRDFARTLVPEGRFLEVYVKCDVETAEARDPKGLYAKARRGEIADMTGVGSAYEEPAHPGLVIDTRTAGIDDAMDALYSRVME